MRDCQNLRHAEGPELIKRRSIPQPTQPHRISGRKLEMSSKQRMPNARPDKPSARKNIEPITGVTCCGTRRHSQGQKGRAKGRCCRNIIMGGRIGRNANTWEPLGRSDGAPNPKPQTSGDVTRNDARGDPRQTPTRSVHTKHKTQQSEGEGRMAPRIQCER